MPNSATMKVGAVALIDALGFKGIWRRHRPRDVLAKFHRLQDQAQRIHNARARRGEPFQVARHVQFLSDTIMIAASASLRRKWKSTHRATLVQYGRLSSLRDVCNTVSIIAGSAMAPPAPNLTFRGAIAFGKFHVDGPFLIGPAIDEAAEAHNLPEGAHIWLCPSALDVISKSAGHAFGKDPGRRFPMIRDFPVPMKGGRTYRVDTINPLQFFPCRADAEAAVRAAVATFAGSLDVLVKKQNTEALLAVALELLSFPRPPEEAEVISVERY